MFKTSYLFIISGLLVVADQVTKFIFKGVNFMGIYVEGWELGETKEVFGDYFTFTFVENPGMAFGIEFGAGKILLSLFSVFASFGLIWYLKKIEFAHKGIRTGIMLILSGAVGNMIDRVFYGVIYGESALFYGKVVDFLRVDIPDMFGMTHWPVFNIADACVSVGIVLLIIFNSKLPNLNEAKAGKYIIDFDENNESNMNQDLEKINEEV